MDKSIEKTGPNSLMGRLSRLFGVALLILALCYILGTSLLLPRLGVVYLQEYVQQQLQRELRIQSIDFNPFTFATVVNGLELREPEGELLLSFRSLALDLKFRDLFEKRLNLNLVDLQSPWLHVKMEADGRNNLARLADDASKLSGGEEKTNESDSAALSYLIKLINIDNGTVKVTDERLRQPAVAHLVPIDLRVNGLSSEAGSRSTYHLSAAVSGGGLLQTQGDFGLQPLAVSGGLSLDRLVLLPLWGFAREMLDLDPPGGALSLATEYRFAQREKGPLLQLEKLGLQLDALHLQRPAAQAPMLALERLAIADARFDLDQNQLELGAVEIVGGSLKAIRQGGRLDWEDIVKVDDQKAAAPELPAATDHQQAAGRVPPDWGLVLRQLKLERLAIGFDDRDLARPLQIKVAGTELALSAAARQKQGELTTNVDGLSLGLARVSLLRDGDKASLLALDQVRLQQGRLDLQKRAIDVGSLQLNGGHARIVLQQDGRLEWERVWVPAAVASNSTPATSKTRPAAEKEWQVNLASFGLSGFSVAVRDAGVKPTAALDLTGLQLKLRDLDSRLQKPVAVELSTAIKQGGQLALSGIVDAARPGAELDIDLNTLSLMPAQSYLKPQVRMKLKSGLLSTKGKLRYGWPEQDALAFNGHARVDKLLISELNGGEPLLGWEAMEVAGLQLALKPDRLQIGEVKFDRPQGKFVINKDASTNWQKILYPQKNGKPVAARTEGASGAIFPISVGRVTVESGRLDFADLGLPLPFATEIHELGGAVVGISSEPGARASSDLKGRVDEFGTALIKGDIAPFDPLLFTDMGVVFSNLDVPSLTPYSAKFAGYKIDSGKLSLDLKYRIEGRKLRGENQIVLEKLKLGEKIESPDAIDAPLELAIALMEDSRGVIDLGLPISGDLDDPEFSYGHLVFKAVGNLLSKIVTAPFKVLGALLGVEGDDLDSIAFEPGSAVLLPPQQEKLQAVAKALAERPALVLTIQGRYHEQLDADALRETALKIEINKRLGRKPEKRRGPDPISLSDRSTRKVVEALYGERFSAIELAAIRQQAKPSAGSASTRPAVKPAVTNLYQTLYRKLVDKQPLPSKSLLELGRLRGARIAASLATKGGLQKSRISEQQATAVVSAPGDGEKVMSKLDLSAGK